MTHTLRSLCTLLARAARCLAIFAAVLLAAPALAAGVNVAAQSNGGVATASTVYSTGYPVAAVNNGDRKGLNWGAGGGWNDSTASVWPDWVQISFSGQKTINEVHVFTLQDSYTNPAEPTAAMVFTRYGITAFDIQYWNGTAWVTVPGGNISGNNAVWRQVSFPAITTDRIRVQVNASLERYSRITEIEAYDTAGPTNVPPTVSLTSPVNGASYTAPATINLSASAADSDGSVASVKFYRQGADQILIGTGTLTGGSYTYTWSNVAAGSYSLIAKATDNQGAVTTSTAVSISVTSPPPPPPSVSLYYLYADHLNTPRVATDSTNKVVWRWDSDAFGTSTANEDPDGDGVKFTYNPRFPGQYFDKETNLHYNYFRDYEPSTGRYVQSDPIGLAGGLNTYGYVGGNPLSYVDPKGLAAEATLPGIGIGSGSSGAGIGIETLATLGACARAVTLIGGALFPSGISQCQDFPQPEGCVTDDECSKLIAQIQDVMRQLNRRYMHQCRNKKNQWEEHVPEFENTKIHLAKLVARAEAKNCQVPPKAYEWLKTSCPLPGTPRNSSPGY